MTIFTEQPKKKPVIESFVTLVDLSASQYCFVEPVQTSSGKSTVQLPATQGNRTIGILQNKPTAGQVAEVCMEGESPLVSNGAFNNGIELMSATTGKGLAATAGNYVAAIALEASSAVGAQVLVSLHRYKI